MPEISPSSISTTRQVALLVEAQVRNVSAESKVSGEYPAADNRLAIAARISGSSSTTATVFLPVDMIFQVHRTAVRLDIGGADARQPGCEIVRGHVRKADLIEATSDLRLVSICQSVVPACHTEQTGGLMYGPF